MSKRTDWIRGREGIAAERNRVDALDILHAMYQDAAAIDVLHLRTDLAVDRLVAAELPERKYRPAVYRLLERFVAICYPSRTCCCVTFERALEHHRALLERELDELALERLAKRLRL